MDPHVLDPEQVILVGDVVEHLGEDESHDLPVLLGNETEAAVEVRLEVVPAAGPEVVLPLLREVLPLVLQRLGEVLADAGELQLADLLDVPDFNGTDLHAHISSGAPMPRQSRTSARTVLVHSTRVSLASLRGPASRTDTAA